MIPLSVRLRIYFGTDLAIGPGRIELLERVQQTGSLAKAAREMGMSYRRAWQLMQSLNQSLASPATVAATGGRGGGGATVTPNGLALIRAYRRWEAGATRNAKKQLAKFAPSEVKGSQANAKTRPLVGKRPA